MEADTLLSIFPTDQPLMLVILSDHKVFNELLAKMVSMGQID
jgi:hypothetical protein